MTRPIPLHTPVWYAIRHTPTNMYLPAVSSYGFTRTEPSATHPPRLFKNRHNATQALNWWLSGEAYETRRYREDEWGGTQEIDIKVIPKPGRRAEDFEIVVVRLNVTTLEEESLAKL